MSFSIFTELCVIATINIRILSSPSPKLHTPGLSPQSPQPPAPRSHESTLYAVCYAESLSCPLLATPWTVARQVPLSMGILQATILQWVAMPSSRGSSPLRDRTQVSHIACRFFTVWATREATFCIDLPFWTFHLNRITQYSSLVTGLFDVA